MRRKLATLGFTTLLVALVTAFTIAPVAAAKKQPTIPATSSVASSVELVKFTGSKHKTKALLEVTNQVTGQTALVNVLVRQQQNGETCTLLDLTIGPIDLFLLGLHLHIDEIHIVLTAQRGTLLGDLLCGLFFGPASPQVLNKALQSGQVQIRG